MIETTENLMKALAFRLNPGADEDQHERLKLTVFIPNECSVRDLLRVTFWFKGHEPHEEESHGNGLIVSGFVKQDHLEGMVKALLEAKGGITY